MNMTLRKKTLILIGVTFVGLILLLYALSQLVLLRNFAALEEQDTRRNVARALDALSRELFTLDKITGDWAEWDDTYAFIEDTNPGYVASNLVDTTFTGLRLNLALFVHSSGRIVFSKAFDLQNEKEMPVPASLQAHLSADGPLLQHSDAEGNTIGIVLLPEGPLLVASRPILTSERQGPARGTLIFGRYLDATKIELLAEITHLSLAVSRFDDPQMLPDFQVARASLSDKVPVLVRALSAQTIAGYALLKDIYGKPTLVLKVEMPRDVYRQGQASIRYFALLLLAVGLVSGAVTLSLLERLILSRLARLSAEISRIGAGGDLSARVSVMGKDELSSLAGAINGTLAALEQSQRRLWEREAQFRAIFEGAAIGVALVDMEGHPIMSNPALQEMLGYSGEELRSMVFTELAHPDDVAVDRALVRELLDGKRDYYQMEKRYIRKDGRLVWGYLSASLVRDADGKPRFAIGMVEDITERKQAEEALHRRDAILKAVAFAAEQFLSIEASGQAATWDRSIQEILTRLGRAAEVSRSYIFEIYAGPDGALYASYRHEWVAPGIIPQIDNPELQNFPGRAGGFARWEEALSRGQPIYGHVREFPESEQRVLLPQEVQSLVVVPIFVGDGWWGFIGFDECLYEREWSAVEVDALRAAAGVLGAAVQRKRAGEALARRAHEMTALYEISLEINSQPDLPTLLHKIVQQAVRLLRARMGGLYLVRPDGETLELVVGYNLSSDHVGTALHLGEGLAGRVAQTGKPIMVDDHSRWEGRAAVYVGAPFRRVLGVPLNVGGKVIGVIDITDDEKTGTFDENEVRLVSLFADQAAIAIENARLYDEAQRRLREVALLSRVITLTASAANLQAALQEVCTELAHFFQVPQAGFALLNPQRTAAEVIAEHRAPDRPSALGLLIPVTGNPSMTYILEHKTPLAIADAQSDPLLAPVHEIMRQRSIASILLVPILIGGEVAGTLGIDAFQRREFSEADIALAQNVASQVGQVLERLRLFTATQERNERMVRLASLSEGLNRPLDVREVVAVIGQGALALSGADRVAVYLRNPDDTISYPWSQGLSQAYLAQVIACIEELPGGRLPERFEPMLISDIQALRGGARFRHLSRAEGHQAMALWPLVYEGRTVAAVGCYYDAPHIWSEAEREIMQAFARQAAIALENARLYASLREANEQLRAAVQARDEMIQNVSHELRTPLALIMGYVELLNEQTLGPLTSEQEQTLGVLYSQSDRLHYMVNRLLTLQTLDTRVLEKIQLDVGHLLREIVRAWETRATQAGVKLRLEVSPDLPLLWAEYDLLSQVIVNLLDNAIKFSPNGGTVTARAYATAADQEHVAVGSQQPAVMVEVSDQGIGIPPEKLELLFRRFYQVDGSSTRQFGGMGIGLALCKAIVEAHGGRIWAESEGEGRGSTFYVALPAAGDGEME